MVNGRRLKPLWYMIDLVITTHFYHLTKIDSIFISQRALDGISDPKDYDIWYAEKTNNG